MDAVAAVVGDLVVETDPGCAQGLTVIGIVAVEHDADSSRRAVAAGVEPSIFKWLLEMSAG